MKIILVNKFLYKRGGSETYFLSLADLLEKSGHTVYFFGMENEKNQPRPEQKFYIKNIDYAKKSSLFVSAKQGLKSIYSFEAKNKFAKMLDEYKPDIVHINLVHRQITLSILDECKKRGVPVVFTAHDLVCSCPVGSLLTAQGETCRKCYAGHFGNCVKNKCIKNSRAKSAVAYAEQSFYKIHHSYDLIDAYIAPSRFYKNEIENSNITNNPVYHLTNFLPLKTEYKIHSHENYFLFLGSLTKNKGVFTLAKAFYKSKINSHYLVIAGTGPEQEKLADFIEKNNLSKKIILPGFVSGEELKKLTRNAYAVVMASEWFENCPYGIMEPMAFGKPVIGARIGGIPEFAIDNETGWTFESGNADELAAVLKKAANADKEEYKKLCEGAYNFAKQNFDAENYLEKLLKIYNGLISKPTGENI